MFAIAVTVTPSHCHIHTRFIIIGTPGGAHSSRARCRAVSLACGGGRQRADTAAMPVLSLQQLHASGSAHRFNKGLAEPEADGEVDAVATPPTLPDLVGRVVENPTASTVVVQGERRSWRTTANTDADDDDGGGGGSCGASAVASLSSSSSSEVKRSQCSFAIPAGATFVCADLMHGARLLRGLGRVYDVRTQVIVMCHSDVS